MPLQMGTATARSRVWQILGTACTSSSSQCHPQLPFPVGQPETAPSGCTACAADYSTPREEVDASGWNSLPDAYAFHYQDVSGALLGVLGEWEWWLAENREAGMGRANPQTVIRTPVLLWLPSCHCTLLRVCTPAVPFYSSPTPSMTDSPALRCAKRRQAPATVRQVPGSGRGHPAGALGG